MKKAFYLLSIALIWSACATASLFNGSDLKGWHAYGTEKWYAEEGNLIAESGPDREYGYLCTDQQYDDFDISLEFMMVSNGNSGLFIRSTVSGTKVSGWQVEIAPEKDKTGGVYESYGRGWLKLPEESTVNPLKANDWNLLRARVVGAHIETWLNGQSMVTLDDQKIGDGHGSICLQIHAGNDIKVKFRNIKIKEMVPEGRFRKSPIL
ncbi:MAG TPA: DUF1080 domain-containing protein [Saprospiraceae bacterium]|nr:DUF1080 domain-containing protein [Saprospiraceae bacterium]